MSHLFLVEDDPDVAFALSRLVASEGWTIEHAATISEANEKLAVGDFDVALLDLSLPDGNSLSLAEHLSARQLPFIVLSGRDEATAAVAAMKAGALDYLLKPYSREALASAVTRACKHRPPRKKEPQSADGDSPLWRKALEQVNVAARAPRAPVLIIGETGSGKEVIANRIHLASERRAAPFVALNSACLSEAIVESELFGHEAGAFTDAKQTRRGVFELAHTGTLLLDEVGELPLPVQAKLLRVIETGRFRRVGGEREIKVDVRIIAATHRNLDDPTRFRADLLQRLTVFEIAVPALRDRAEDVLVLARGLLTELSRDLGRQVPVLDESAEALLLEHQWPGNVRELKNAIERALLTRPDARTLAANDFALRRPNAPVAAESLDGLVSAQLKAALAENNGNISATARRLGVSRNRVKRLLRR